MVGHRQRQESVEGFEGDLGPEVGLNRLMKKNLFTKRNKTTPCLVEDVFHNDIYLNLRSWDYVPTALPIELQDKLSNRRNSAYYLISNKIK